MFYFRVGDEEQLLLSSADWMSRNMFRRIELIWPINDPKIRQQVLNECLLPYLHDNTDAWCLGADGVYTRAVRAKGDAALSIHAALVRKYTTEAPAGKRRATNVAPSRVAPLRVEPSLVTTAPVSPKKTRSAGAIKSAPSRQP
jgi:hypothetical protein